MIEIVAILVATGDGEYAGAQDVGDTVGTNAGLRWSVVSGASLAAMPSEVSMGGQRHHAAIEGHAPTVERGDDFLASDGGKGER